MGNANTRNGLLQKLAAGTLVAGIAVFGASLVVDAMRPASPTDDERPSVSNPKHAGTERPKPSADGKPEGRGDGVPLLEYFSEDKDVARLVADMEAGRVPKSCDVLYDQMGANPSLEVTAEGTIRDIYELVEGITVPKDGVAMPITDSYHHVYFTLQDGTKVGWSFEGMGCIDRGKDTIAVVGDGNLWAYVIQLSGDLDEAGTSAGGGTGATGSGSPNAKATAYDIDIEDTHGLLVSCPTSAKAGETVIVETCDMADAYPVVKVDKGDVYVETTGATMFEFVMPDHDVTVLVSYSTYGMGGA